jgi:penicillin amidase
MALRMRRVLRRVAIVFAILLGLIVLAAGGSLVWVTSRVRASLPRLEGQVVVDGLSAVVSIERDARGVPTIVSADELDQATAIGFLHGQERFFQMDLLRRSAAGELSELFGSAALAADRRSRLHRFRHRAQAIEVAATAAARAILQAYAAGVNAGLADLGAAPPEYLLLRSEPAPWLPEDSTLVLMAMYLDLQGGTGRREADLGLMRDLLPRELFEFLAPRGSEWEAPLVGPAFSTPEIPGPDVLDLRAVPPEASSNERPVAGAAEKDPGLLVGSNNWAVAGSQTAHGGALLANDMHLGLAMPNIWYRASLVRRDEHGELRTTGVTLPGFPVVVAGSNGHIAWGFTNSYGDWIDLVLLETDAQDDERYRTPQGWLPFERHRETIRVKDAEDEELEILSTIWGPVIDRDPRGRRRAVHWVAHDPAAYNIDLARLSDARSVDEALDVAIGCGIPTQNIVVADSAGRIGWAPAGVLPRRVGFDGQVPASWADGSRRWDGWLDSPEYPRVVDPASGRLWTANNRTVDGEMLARMGDGGFSDGARARQIRDGLLALDRATEADMLRIQLDDRALFLERWRELLLDVLSPETVVADLLRAELRHHVEHGWTGRASIDSVGYRMVRAFRLFLAEAVFESITAPCAKADPAFRYLGVGRWEGPLWRLASERPPHLLDPRYDSWDDQMDAVIDRLLDNFLDDEHDDLSRRTWGERNTVRIQHPLSHAVPQLSRWLDMPSRALPGDDSMPRVQSVTFGASQRMVVSPGREEQGLFHMPGGQSGHPFSPYYRSGHEDWAEGRPAPFLPGPAVHRLTLAP